MGQVRGKEKRSRTPKAKIASKLSLNKFNAPNTSTKRRAKKGSKPVGPGTRLGTSEEIPITISDDDDDDDDNDESFTADEDARRIPDTLPDLSRFRYSTTVSSPTPSLRSIYSPFNDVCSPTGFILRRSSPPPSIQLPIRESREQQQTGEAVVRPTTMRAVRTSKAFCRVKEDTPGPYKYRSRKTSSSKTTLSSNAMKSPKAPSTILRSDIHDHVANSDRVELTLADIPDFDLRSKVAQLMAVAPAIPVRDLYYLLMDSEGQFPIAKERAVRASEAPRQSKKPLTSPSSARRMPILARPTQDSDDDEIMVKIDPNDPAFEWDTDAPEPEPLEEQRRPTLKRSKARPSNSKPKPIAKRINTTGAEKIPKCSPRPSKSSIESRPNVNVKRTSGPSAPSKRKRDNSINRDFLVPDDGTCFDSDVSYSDDYSEHGEMNGSRSGIEMDGFVDRFDLNNDMRARHRSNTGILNKQRRSN